MKAKLPVLFAAKATLAVMTLMLATQYLDADRVSTRTSTPEGAESNIKIGKDAILSRFGFRLILFHVNSLFNGFVARSIEYFLCKNLMHL